MALQRGAIACCLVLVLGGVGRTDPDRKERLLVGKMGKSLWVLTVIFLMANTYFFPFFLFSINLLLQFPLLGSQPQRKLFVSLPRRNAFLRYVYVKFENFSGSKT